MRGRCGGGDGPKTLVLGRTPQNEEAGGKSLECLMSPFASGSVFALPWPLWRAGVGAWASGGGNHPQLLTDDPVCGCFLRLPRLQELFGDALEILGIGCGINGSAKPLDFKTLADR